MQLQAQSVSSVATLGGTFSFGPYTVTGSITPVINQAVLGSGDNAFTVPTGSVGMIIIPPTTNGVALRAKMISGTSATVTVTAPSSAITAVAVAAGGSGYPPSTSLWMAPDTALGSGAFFYATVNSSGVITAFTFVSSLGGSTYVSYTGTAVAVKPAESGISIPPALPWIHYFDSGNLPAKVWLNAVSATSGYTQALFF